MDKRNPGFMQFTRNPSDINYPKPEKKLGWLPHPSPGCHTLQLSGLKLFPCSSFHSHSSLLFMFSSTWSYLSCRSPNDGCMHWGFPAAVPVPPPCYPSSMSIHSFSHSLIISMPPPILFSALSPLCRELRQSRNSSIPPHAFFSHICLNIYFCKEK